MSSYLFRLDMAKDNEQFLSLRKEYGVDYMFSGTPLKIGPGWLPDYCEINVSKTSCKITLIELEATDIVARVSCRKYLPENSLEIVKAIISFIDNIISQCRSTADPRLEAFESLVHILKSDISKSIHTAGALRTAPNFIEDFPLIDQPEESVSIIKLEKDKEHGFIFKGERSLTRLETEGLRRTLRIIHAVIIGRDRSGSTFKSWRGRRNKPLDDEIKKEKHQFAMLDQLLFTSTVHGLEVNCDEINKELLKLWVKNKRTITSDQIKTIIEQFYFSALSIQEHEPMQNIFRDARQILDKLLSVDGTKI